MGKRILFASLVGFGMATALPAVAEQHDPNGYQSIAARDYTGAVRTLEGQRRLYPARPELMLNLAAAYQRVGRVGDARALYRQVLARPTVNMDMPNGAVVSSHALATLALTRMPTDIAAR